MRGAPAICRRGWAGRAWGASGAAACESVARAGGRDGGAVLLVVGVLAGVERGVSASVIVGCARHSLIAESGGAAMPPARREAYADPRTTPAAATTITGSTASIGRRRRAATGAGGGGDVSKGSGPSARRIASLTLGGASRTAVSSGTSGA